jgi:hypothetical protein
MGKKTPNVTPSKAQSSFDKVNNYTYNLGGFGQSSSTKQGDTISTNVNYNPALQGHMNQANQGIATAQQQLSTPYATQLQQLDQGQNSAYNYLKAQNDQNYRRMYGDVQTTASQGGLENSTLLGGWQAQNAQDYNMNDLAARTQALDTQNALAQNSLASNSGILAQMYGYGSGLGDMTNNNQMTGLQNKDQVSMFNASQEQQANLANQQAAIAAAQRRSAMIGNILGAGLSLASIPLAGAFGPAAALAKGLGGAGAVGQSFGNLGAMAGLGNQTPYLNMMGIGPKFMGGRL